ncbi:MAG: DUF5694 domain-containing protein [Pseudomonadota bacterium]
MKTWLRTARSTSTEASRLSANSPVMLRIAFLVLFAFIGRPALAEDGPPSILVLGVFHFANPGKDVVKTKQIDVMTAENQSYLDQLANRLCEFRPTKVLVELTQEKEEEFNDQFAQYLAGKLSLRSNEVHQIAFRVAKKMKLDGIYGYDDLEIGWAGGELFEQMQVQEPDKLSLVQEEIAAISKEIQRAHLESNLRELLLMSNDPIWDRRNMDLYLLTNDVGSGANFIGADTAARWWHRNLRMYANIQSHAVDGARLLVIGGQGHTAIFKQLISIDRRVVGHDVTPYLH